MGEVWGAPGPAMDQSPPAGPPPTPASPAPAPPPVAAPPASAPPPPPPPPPRPAAEAPPGDASLPVGQIAASVLKQRLRDPKTLGVIGVVVVGLGLRGVRRR